MSPDLSGLSLIQLRCFLAVIDAGSFAEAGRRLGMTTSGISKTVSRLEAGHGLRLLHRSTHALSPTEAGERLIGVARAALRSVEDAEALLGELAGSAAAGRVRISAPTAFVRTCLVPILPGFLASHPDILLDLRASDTTVDLADAGIDLAIRSGSLDGLPGHIRLPWFVFPWVACATPGYLAQRGVPATPADLGTHDLIGFRNTRTGLVEPWRLRDCNLIASPPSWRLVLDDAEAAWCAVLAGVGIAWAPRWLAANSLCSGAVVEALRPWRGANTPMSILRRDRSLVPDRVQAVIGFLQSHTATFGGG